MSGTSTHLQNVEASRRNRTRLYALIAIAACVAVVALGVDVLSVPTILHKSVTVSGTVYIPPSETPLQVTFTDVNDTANATTVPITSSRYSVTVPNGHSYNIRVVFSYASQYQYECDSYGPGDCQSSANTTCRYDYELIGEPSYAVYTCTEYQNHKATCTGVPLNVNVSGDTMNFDVQCT